MFASTLFRRSITIGLAMIAGTAAAQGVRVNVASFNLGWWINANEFSEVLVQCNAPARNWCDPRDSSQCAPTTKGLPPCNAYTEYVRTPGASGSASEVVPVFTPTAGYWKAKRLALELTLRNVAPDVIAFQEISGMAAAKDAMGAARDEFSYCQSSDRDPQNPEAQRLVIAARNSVFTMTGCQTDQSLAVEDVRSPGHFTRPALIAGLTGPGGKPWRVATVHLKSGCASPAGDPKFDFRGAYLDSTDNPNCPTLRKQVEPLERLIEREGTAGSNFILLGDFNRKLDLEANAKAGTARAGGAAGTGLPDTSTAVRLLWPEVNDRDPAGSELTLFLREPRSSSCAENEGLDHVAVSKNLAAVNRGVRTREVELAKFGGHFLASDHCPLVVQLLAT